MFGDHYRNCYRERLGHGNIVCSTTLRLAPMGAYSRGNNDCVDLRTDKVQGRGALGRGTFERGGLAIIVYLFADLTITCVIMIVLTDSSLQLSMPFQHFLPITHLTWSDRHSTSREKDRVGVREPASPATTLLLSLPKPALRSTPTQKAN
jgi:hypothetical protein